MLCHMTACVGPRVTLVDLVSTVEASRILGVHRATVCRWVEKGKLPGIQVGHGEHGFLVFARADVLELDRRRRELLAEVIA